ncbi:hypothetical protein HU200_034606 [Digitaria exilis]|uniref:Uncharacterized protein n=1 Tax=Digitaria exilis TaxID=1010633 RepID=A0A835BPZ2_9POAL|nr:hypothetical protein HU200_034606 [Digitaria exilis]
MKQLMDDNNDVLEDWKENQMSPCYWDHGSKRKSTKRYHPKFSIKSSKSLEGNYIFGEIPPELGNLSTLVNLNLGGNDLDGSIPDSLGNLKRLQEL